jgi:hypothetical protein
MRTTWVKEHKHANKKEELKKKNMFSSEFILLTVHPEAIVGFQPT